MCVVDRSIATLCKSQKDESSPMKLALSLWLTLTALPAQSQPVLTVNLGANAASPGERVTLPVTFSAPGDLEVGEVSFALSFPPALIRFIEAIKGSTAEWGEIEIKAQLRHSDANEGEDILQLDVRTSQRVPDGLLIKLAFEISEEAQAGSVIQLRNLKQTARSTDGKAIEARGTEGSVIVIPTDSPAIFGCFFYMH